MTDDGKQTVFLIDSEPLICNVVERILASTGVRFHCFLNAIDCLSLLGVERCDLLITDIKLPDIDGITLLKNVKTITPWLPVLIVTAYADVPTAVAATKVGTEDILEKPLDEDHFKCKVRSILERSSIADAWQGRTLTKSEMMILRLVVDAKSNKEIAHLLHRSVRTIEVHRSHIMRKLGVGNLVDLVKRTVAMGLVELPARPRRTKNRLEVVKSD